MKIITKKPIRKELIGERKIGEYSYKEETGESNDGMRRSYTYTVHCTVYGTIENEIKNIDGTYTYEYSSRVDSDHYRSTIRNPEQSKSDLKEMIEELLFKYNIHNFSTDLQEKPNSIKDYYASIDASSLYEKDEEPNFSYKWDTYSKGREDYTKNDGIIWSSYERIKSESMEDINAQLNRAFSKDDYICYLMGEKVKKTYKMKLGLDEISDDETVRDFLGRMLLENPKYSTFEEALKENIISMEDIKNLILRCQNLSAKNIPSNILEQLFEEDNELISHFNERNMPIDILRKYSPNFDISKVSPNDLSPSDLENVLQNIIQNKCILGIYNGPSETELKEGYWEYLQKFYDNPQALRKIIPVINTSEEYFFRRNAEDFVCKISPEVLETNEIRDILLNTENISLNQILDYQLDFDYDSAKKLLGLLSNTTSVSYLKNINSILTIIQQNGISNEEILQALRENGFNIIKSDNQELEEFMQLGIKGITIDDIHNTMLKEKDFWLLSMLENKDENQITKEFYDILNILAEKKEKSDDKDKKRYEEMFELIENYSNTQELFSNLNPEIKNLTKKIIIENLDLNKQMEEYSIYGRSFSKIMKTLTTSFNINMQDITTIYMKCLNTGAHKEKIIKAIEEFIPEEQRKEFESTISKLNIYPAPKYFWLTDKNLKRISIDWNKENRGTIKNKIQADGRCFSTRIKTDLVGISKDGEKYL